jgi:hypothetical protein
MDIELNLAADDLEIGVFASIEESCKDFVLFVRVYGRLARGRRHAGSKCTSICRNVEMLWCMFSVL